VKHIGDWHVPTTKPNPAQVRIDFFEVVDGKFVNITE
jgi:hypothetical protein